MILSYLLKGHPGIGGCYPVRIRPRYRADVARVLNLTRDGIFNMLWEKLWEGKEHGI